MGLHTCGYPDIKVNGSEGPIVIYPRDPLTVAVSLALGIAGEKNADWWAVAATPFDTHWLTQQGWVRSDTPIRAYAGPLFNLTTTTILQIVPSPTPVPSETPMPRAPNAPFGAAPLSADTTAGLPQGTYTFYFGVDTTMDGIPNEPIYLDSVEVKVVP